MSAVRESAILIDGHSVIFDWKDLASLHHSDAESARLELVRRLSEFQSLTGTRIVVVFDGNQPRRRKRRKPKALRGPQVIYADQSCTADDLIERLVARYAEEIEFTVVTRDRAEIDAVSALGAWVSSPRAFLNQIEREENRLRSRLNKGLHRR